MPTRRYTIIAVLSGLAACIISGFLLFTLAQNSVRRAEQAGETVVVVVAAEDLAVGTRLSSDMLDQIRFLKSSLPQGYFPEVDALIGQVLITPAYAGQIILQNQIGSVNEASPSSMVPPNHVAYALAIDPEWGVGGLLRAGDHIDIISTTAGTYGEEGETIILIEDVIIVGVAGEFPFGPAPTPTPDPEESSRRTTSSALSRSNTYGENIRSKILILDMTPEQARSLAEARANAIVSIALHSSK